jgi:hypothetical protein
MPVAPFVVCVMPEGRAELKHNVVIVPAVTLQTVGLQIVFAILKQDPEAFLGFTSIDTTSVDDNPARSRKSFAVLLDTGGAALI